MTTDLAVFDKVKAEIETEIYHFFLFHVFIDSAVNAIKAMQAIRDGKVPHVTINY